MSNNYKEYASKEELEAVDKVFTGATSSTDGANGLVPAPTKGNQSKYLKADGTWGTPYTHPTTAGNKHIPAGGSSGQILKWSADGTAKWMSENSYDIFKGATSSNNGEEGLVPAPTPNEAYKYLRADGTWDQDYYIIDIASIEAKEVTSTGITSICYDDYTIGNLKFTNEEDDLALHSESWAEYMRELYSMYGNNIYIRIHNEIILSLSHIINDASNKVLYMIFRGTREDYSMLEQAPSKKDTIYDSHLFELELELGTSSESIVYFFYQTSFLWGQLDRAVTTLSTNKLNKFGDTLTGVLKAQSNTNYTTYQVRNIAFSTSASTPTGNGSILGVYS